MPRRPAPDADPLGLRDDSDPLGLFRAKRRALRDTASLPVVGADDDPDRMPPGAGYPDESAYDPYGPDPDDLDRFPSQPPRAAGPSVEVPLLPPVGTHRAPRRRKRVLAVVAAAGATALTASWLASNMLGGGSKPTESVADDATHFSVPTQDDTEDDPSPKSKAPKDPESPARHAKPPVHLDRSEPETAATYPSASKTTSPSHASPSSEPSAPKTSDTSKPPQQAAPPDTTSPSPSDPSSGNDDNHDNNGNDDGGFHLWPLF